MAEPTIVLRSPVKSITSSLRSSSPNPTLNSPTHNSTVIILKDNNNDQQQHHQSTSTVKTSFPSLKTVQPKLYSAGHTGLYNLGNTCYVNCVLQLLSHVPQFCDAICSMSFESLGLEQPSDVPMVPSSHNPTRLKGGGRGLLKAFEAQPRRVPCYLAYELHGTFNIIWSGKCMVYSPLNMIAAVRRLLPTFEPCAMEDAQEFLEALLSAVTDEIRANKLAATNIINDLLGFSSESQILCEQCHRLSVTKTDETFITLTFSEKMLCDARGSSRRRSCHLTEMLAHFYQWEALSTPFQCSNCAVRSLSKEGTKAQKRLLISKLPQVLHVVLRRFRSLPQTTLRRPTSRQARQLSHKITLHVNFDEYLDMAPYCTQSTTNSFLSTRSKQYETTPNDCLYRLRGVIVHYGKSINTGHFVAYVYNDTLGEWLRCDDHIIEQTTFETVKTSDAYILVYSRCTSTSSISSNPSESSMTCQLRKRKRAISVDNLNEQKDDESVSENPNESSKKQENSDKHSNVTKSLQFYCLNLDPLANGLRRRAQSLNFAIRSSQSSIDITRQNTSLLPVGKRRRKEPVNTLSSSSKLPPSQVIRTRKKSSSILINHDLLSMPKKVTKTTRRRRRGDPFIRKRRMTKTSNRHQINLSNLVSIPSTDQTMSSESLLPSIQSPLSFTYESPKNSNIPVTKRIGRIRIQRCMDGSTTNSTVRLITSGETNTRLSLPSQSSTLLTNLITARRSNSLNNPISNPSNC
jgi:ubiquitin C-terminal hydrolase